MFISPVASTTVAPAAPASAPSFRAPTREIGLLDLHGVGFFELRDSLTGYGRPQGYDSLANARRAAYALSAGEASPAAGVFRQGSRFFVRSLEAIAAKGPHDGPDAAAPAARGAQLLRFEGNADAHFAWVRHAGLELIVDGATRIWGRDAHHAPPAA
ncbi:MAG: hypothetical protein JWM90_2602 [Thermoleophilia bacterium]|nr:hypothetical protein [Thermoleophilia bacterium]